MTTRMRKKRGGAPLMWMKPMPTKGDEIQLRTFHGTFRGRFDKLIDDNALFLNQVERLRNGKWVPSQFILYQVAPAEDDEAGGDIPHMFIKNDIETIEIIGKPSGASRAAGGRKRKTKRRKEERAVKERPNVVAKEEREKQVVKNAVNLRDELFIK